MPCSANSICSVLRAGEHGGCEIDAGDVRSWPAAAQKLCTVAGAATGIKNVCGSCGRTFELGQQALAYGALHDGGTVVGDGGAVKGFANA